MDNACQNCHLLRLQVPLKVLHAVTMTLCCKSESSTLGSRSPAAYVIIAWQINADVCFKRRSLTLDLSWHLITMHHEATGKGEGFARPEHLISAASQH